ncbi:membrane integrity-associated transporter subunit PqiC [Oceanimonas sp. MB9]|uniref:PqiC family protein n=1 Tax=Oceanimonas sp. MB9 TaxID=2588453 RepID=UPI0013F63452|nr:ABC-type transport auxiliary lipoprotein family protein [Oceanimonas sp. MB9]NHI02027.1 hypothetical protein [Oceanimonas sp. MB9]
MTTISSNPLRLAPLLLALTLAGCGGPAGSGASSYLLPASPATRQHDSRLIVNLAPIDTATFLDGEGIVMQLDELEVHQARGHLWAEALPNQLQHLLQRRLSSALPQAQVVTRGQVQATSTAGEGRELRLRLDRFQGRYDGIALIQGQWQLLNHAGVLLEQQDFRIETPLSADGYPALVRSLASGWEQLADGIATELVRQR